MNFWIGAGILFVFAAGVIFIIITSARKTMKEINDKKHSKIKLSKNEKLLKKAIY